MNDNQMGTLITLFICSSVIAFSMVVKSCIVEREQIEAGILVKPAPAAQVTPSEARE